MNTSWSRGRKILLMAGSLSVGLLFAWLIVWVFQPVRSPPPADRDGGVPAVAAKNLFPESVQFRRATFRVVDSQDERPISNASVSLLYRGQETEIPFEEGSFELDGAIEDDTLLEVATPGYHASFAAIGTLPESGALVPVVAGGPLSIHCFSSDTAEPVEGAAVSIEQPGGSPVSGLTGGDGRLELRDFGLEVRSNHPEVKGLGCFLTIRAVGFLPKHQEVPAGPGGDWRRVEVALDRGQPIVLQAIDSSTGEPVAGVGALHQWDDENVGRANDFEEPVKTDERGLVTLLTSPRATRMELVALHPNYAPAGAILSGLQDKMHTSPGGRVEVTLRLERGFEVEGLVLDDNDEPLRHVTADLDPLRREDFNDWMRYAAHKFFHLIPDLAFTDAEGFFKLPRVAAGEYRVILHHEEFTPDPVNPILTVGPEGTTWLGLMKRGIELKGTVVGAKGEAVPGAQIFFLRELPDTRPEKGFSRVVFSDENGAFLIRGLASGPYQASIVGPAGYAPFKTEVDPEKSRTRSLIFVRKDIAGGKRNPEGKSNDQ